jgi:2-oxoglutarate ferredoxin oxidoreductase subunit alpha
MTDLDLGMNDHVSPPFQWDDNRNYKRGKVLNAEMLDKMERFGRYLDTENDGIPYRTYPATHPTKGSFFTRGTSRDEYAAYTEDGAAYKRNVDRLLRKWNTAKNLVPTPHNYDRGKRNKEGILFFGTSMYAVEEALDILAGQGLWMDAMRIKAFPFNKDVEDFINDHKRVYVVEQNRDAQMRSLLMIELSAHAEQLIPVLNYDGMPITADAIVKGVVSTKESAAA